MGSTLHQRNCIRFCVENELDGAQTYKMLEDCFGTDTMPKASVFEWHKRFESGQVSVNDDELGDRSATSSNDNHIDEIKKLLGENHKLTIRDLVANTQISPESAQQIIRDQLGLRRVAGKLVPRELNFLHKRDRVDIAKDMLSHACSDQGFIKRIITGDHTWIYYEDDQQSGEPNAKKARSSQPLKKTMLTVFIDYNGVVHHEFLPEGQVANRHYYVSVLKRLREVLRIKRPNLWKNNSWVLHQDNAPYHNTVLVRRMLNQNKTNVIQHPADSPDLAPCDFFLFERLKKQLRETRFDSEDELVGNMKAALRGIQANETQQCFEGWVERWRKCIAAQGDYFDAEETI